ncbi:MAG: TolC family protein [Bacteroidia bacterium]
MKANKSLRLSALLLFMSAALCAQDNTTLEQVLNAANTHYPLTKQRDLVEQSKDFSLAALNRAFLPQLSINGQATYQSEVTELPIKINLPGLNIEGLDKDQYKATADVNQILFDGGNISAQKNVARANANVEQMKIEVEMQKMREKVRQLFLGVLMMDEQIKQTEIVASDLSAGIKKMEAALKNGTAFRSQLAVLQAEEIKNRQRKTELEQTRLTLLKSLSLFTGIEFPTSIHFEKPIADPGLSTANNAVSRIELHLYDEQEQLSLAQRKQIGVKSLPKLSLFAQGGYGRPGLNMLDNDFSWFYIAGARLNWNLGALYSLHAERQVNAVTRSTINVQRELFLLNANVTIEQYRNDISKYNTLLKDDAQLVSLRDEIKQSAKAQLDNGVITSSDYLREVNAADQARQLQLLHQLQLLQTQLDLTDYLSINKPSYK